MSGLQLASRLEEALGYRPLIVYVTAHRRFEYAEEAVRLGAFDYLVKSISAKSVLDTLGQAVNKLAADRLERIETEHLKKQLVSVLPPTVSRAPLAQPGCWRSFRSCSAGPSPRSVGWLTWSRR